LTPEKVIDILKTIYKVEFETPYSTKKYTKLILKSKEKKALLTYLISRFYLGCLIAQNRRNAGYSLASLQPMPPSLPTGGRRQSKKRLKSQPRKRKKNKKSN
jgi:hypothetical protein